MKLDDMNLPKVNLRKQQSKKMQNLLESEIRVAIISFEK
jgi:hypothetical protein